MAYTYHSTDKTYYCGTYKGYRIYQCGCMIGSGFYGYFYASSKRKTNYVKVKDSDSATWKGLKDKIKNHKYPFDNDTKEEETSTEHAKNDLKNDFSNNEYEEEEQQYDFDDDDIPF